MADIEAIKAALDLEGQLYASVLGAQADLVAVETAHAFDENKARAVYEAVAKKANTVFQKAVETAKGKVDAVISDTTKIHEARDKVVSAKAAMAEHEAKSQSELGA